MSHARRLAPLLLLIVLAGSACGSRARSRCERVCGREAECARDLKLKPELDEGECIEECDKLERDQRFVDVHVKCVDDAKTCEQVSSCP